MVKHRKIVLSVRLSTVPKEITHQREKAEAFDVSGAEFVRLDLRGTQFKTYSISLSVRRGCADAQLAVRAIRLEPTAVGI